MVKKLKTNILKGKTIVQILPALNHGGVERGTIEMSEAILANGGRSVVISAGGVLEDRLIGCGAEHFRLSVHSKNPLKWLIIRKQVKAVLRGVDADLVHIRSRAPAWIAYPAARSLGIYTVTTIHGRFKKTSLPKRIYNSIMTKADRVIAISSYIEGLVLAQFPAIAGKVTVIHRGVDIDAFDRKTITPQRLAEMSKKLMNPHGLPVVMLPARPTAWKGMEVLIAAMGLINDLPFLLVLVGAADGAQEMQDSLTLALKKAGLAEKSRVLNAVDDMPAALFLADVVAMPSTSPEPFGRVAVEASAMGCPVVAFGHGGALESIIHEKTGWLAEPICAESLGAMVQLALTLSPNARKQLAVDARAFITENFSADKMCQATIAVYDDLLSRKHR